MITDERLSKALIYLAETDLTAAELFANMERLEHRSKQIHAAVFLTMDGTIPTKEAKADNHEDYKLAMEAYFTAVQEYKHIANKRTTEELVIRAWQTFSSNRRQAA